MTHIVMAELTALSGREDELSSRITALAVAVRKEAGNEGFEVFTKPGVERGWLMIERYRNREAFERHLKMPHTMAFNEALATLAEGGGSATTDLTATATVDDARPGIRGIDHVGVTVPDIDAATAFLEAAFGARTLYDVLPAGAEPMQGEETEQQLGLPQGARIVEMRLIRIGQSANIEMFRFENTVQGDSASLPDFGLQHVALYVDDMQAACARFRAAGGELLSDPHSLASVEDRPGNVGVYGKTPWGMLIELIDTPGGIDYPADCSLPRWKPQPNL